MREKPAGLTVAILLGLLAVFLITPIVVILFLGAEPPAPSPDDPAAVSAPAPRGAGEVAAVAPQGPGTTVPARTVATRTTPSQPSSEGLAEAPTACILVVDRDGEQPVAGAAVRRVQNGGELAFTDERGLAQLPLRLAEQLAIVADGYLLRLAPTQLGTTEQAPQRVQLVRDDWSIARRFEFRGGDGRQASDVFVRFRPRAQARPASGPPASDAVAARAWTEHAMLAGLPVAADLPVQLGVWMQDRVHRIGHGDTVRFAAPGDYTVEAASEAGFVGQASFSLENAPVGAAVPTVVVGLERGAFATGTVISLEGLRPVAGAEVTLQGGDPLGLVATSGSDGSFRLGPLLRGEGTLHVRHGDHQPLAFGPISTSAAELRLSLQPLPKTTLRGRVRSRPDLLPVAGARLAWSPSGGAVVTGTTGADGTFQLAATGDAAARLAISAPGFLPYAELVQPGSPFAEYDLWPGTMEARLAKGLTARLVGVVAGPDGSAQSGVAVRWIPARRAEPTGMPGRRLLDGASLELPLVATTGPDGSFQLETNQFGPGRLCLAEAGPDAQGGVAVDAVAGTTKDGLRLQR